MNEYMLDAGTASRTDWVVTYPTKRYYVAAGTGAAADGLFQRNFSGDGACDDVASASGIAKRTRRRSAGRLLAAAAGIAESALC